MSLQDVIEFLEVNSSSKNAMTQASSILLAIFEGLIRQTLEVCDKNGYSLTGLEAFSN